MRSPMSRPSTSCFASPGTWMPGTSPGMTKSCVLGDVMRFACQLTRFQVWPPQNMPPKAQPCTRSAFGPFIAIVES